MERIIFSYLKVAVNLLKISKDAIKIFRNFLIVKSTGEIGTQAYSKFNHFLYAINSLHVSLIYLSKFKQTS